jgi:hypothetical protein
MTGRQIEERRERDLPFELAWDQQADGAPLPHDPAHLPQRPDSIGDEHERHLAEHDIEGLVLERQRAGIALTPREVRPDAAGDRQHGLVQIEAGDGAGRGDEVGGGARDDAGTAPDVEHRVPCGDACRGAQDRCPLGKEGRDELRFVALGGLDRDLERLDGFGHGSSMRREGAASIGQLTYFRWMRGQRCRFGPPNAWATISARLRKLSLVRM